MKITRNSLVDLEIRLEWDSSQAKHTDCYYAKRVNLWRDIFPEQLSGRLVGRSPGDRVQWRFDAGSLIPNDPKKTFTVKRKQFESKRASRLNAVPKFGRFYPKGLLKDIPGVFRANIEPFRCLDVDDRYISVDFNHPLAAYEIHLTMIIHQVYGQIERGGVSNDWVEVATDGPGRQARWKDKPTEFIADGAFSRKDENDDAGFYQTCRLVNHLDTHALAKVSDFYSRLLKPGMSILDLMSSWQSHLPAERSFEKIIGLGLNHEELQANRRLDDFLIHDINADPRLPIADYEFNAVLCTVSVEYLTRPFDMFREVNRVLKPSGIFVITFSNRWFPPKVVRIWEEINEFERIGLVIEYFLQSTLYTNLETYSMRGFPRPADDKYYLDLPYSDPVYVVWGMKR